VKLSAAGRHFLEDARSIGDVARRLHRKRLMAWCGPGVAPALPGTPAGRRAAADTSDQPGADRRTPVGTAGRRVCVQHTES
jgi:hypothetical protein